MVGFSKLFLLRSAINGCIALIVASAISSAAVAEISESRHLHHFYNARLLQPGEWQLSVAGNFKIGLTDNYQVGTQGLLTTLGYLNISAKHRMFYGDGWTTALTTHVLSLSADSAQGTDSTSSEDGGEASSSSLIFAPTGVVTTNRIIPGGYLNWGLLDYFVYQSSSSLDSKVSMHLLSPVLGYDQYLSKHWAFGITMSYAAFLFGTVESDAFDLELSANLITGLPSKYNPSIGFATFTYSLVNFNFEFGALVVAQSPIPYLNVFWRVN